MYCIYIQSFFNTEEDTNKNSKFLRKKSGVLVTYETYEAAVWTAVWLAKDFSRRIETRRLRAGEYDRPVYIPKRVEQ